MKELARSIWPVFAIASALLFCSCVNFAVGQWDKKHRWFSLGLWVFGFASLLGGYPLFMWATR